MDGWNDCHAPCVMVSAESVLFPAIRAREQGNTAFWDCPECEEPMGTKPKDLGPCSRCHENTAYSWDEYEKDWMSECCHAPAVSPDQHIGENYKPGHDSDFAF